MLEQLELVDEAGLEWEQVIEFRKDELARQHYRKFRHWLDKAMTGKSIDYVRDEILLNLEAYSAALGKHALRTGVGTMTIVLDPKVFAAASAGYAALTLAGSPVAPWLTAGVVLGNALFRIGKEFLDFKEATSTARGELAFVHDLKRSLR